MKVLITGGSGLVGMKLTKTLLDTGIEVTHLTRQRNSKAGVKTYIWNYKKNFLEEGALNGVTHIVHLAGAGIADKPWTMARKREIVRSRVLTSRLLLDKVKEQNVPLQKFISASGIGYYGAATTEEILTETSARGEDFVAECCAQWERQSLKFDDISKVVILRTGIVLAKEEAALGKMESSIKKGLGAPLGTGHQYMPWIHLRDLVNIYTEAILLENLSGIYNAVSTEHVTNELFMHTVAKAMNKKIRLPRVPAFMMKLIFGEMSEILLNGTRISNEKLLNTGFKFEFNELDAALTDIYQ